MNEQPLREQAEGRSSSGVIRWLIQSILLDAILCLGLFLSAGRLAWCLGWAYVGVLYGGLAATALVMIPRNPELLAERTGVTPASIAGIAPWWA